MEIPKYILNASHVFTTLVVTFNAIFHCHGCWPQFEPGQKEHRKQHSRSSSWNASKMQHFCIFSASHHETKAQIASLPRLLAVCFAARCSLYCCLCDVIALFYFCVLFPKCDKRCLSLEFCKVKGCNAEKVRSASEGTNMLS